MALESDWSPGRRDRQGYQKQSLNRAKLAVDKALVVPGPGVSSYARIVKIAFHHVLNACLFFKKMV